MQLKSRKIEITLYRPTKAIDKRKSLASFRPNYIHSIDSAILRFVFERFKKEEKTLLSIHDAFFTTFGSVKLLKKSYSEGLTEISGHFGHKLNIPFMNQALTF